MSDDLHRKGITYLSSPVRSDFPDEWYQANSIGHFWFEWRLRAIMASIRELSLPLAGLRVMDVGAGAGTVRSQLARLTKWQVDSVELNESALQLLDPMNGEVLCYDITERHVSYIKRYDLLLLMDVVEHIADDEAFVKAAAAHLKPGGYLLINVPALQCLFSKYDAKAGHMRRYNVAALKAVLERAQALPVFFRYWGLSMLPLLVIRKLWLAARKSEQGIIERGFVPPGRLVHAMLKLAMRAETSILTRPPLGTSLIAAAVIPEDAGTA